MKESNKSLEELHDGIKEFQEQTYLIQQDLIDKLSKMQDRIIELEKDNFELSKEPFDEVDRLKDELNTKDRYIQRLQKEN